jgi:predicted nucleic acid-binding protein
MVVVDTTVWVDYLRGKKTAHADWLHGALGTTRIAICDLILCEILQGTDSDAAFARVLSTLSACDLLTTGGRDLAVAAARNYRVLRRRGHTVRKTVDCLIATLCLSQGHRLLHNDRDFDPFESVLGLDVVHP